MACVLSRNGLYDGSVLRWRSELAKQLSEQNIWSNGQTDGHSRASSSSNVRGYAKIDLFQARFIGKRSCTKSRQTNFLDRDGRSLARPGLGTEPESCLMELRNARRAKPSAASRMTHLTDRSRCRHLCRLTSRPREPKEMHSLSAPNSTAAPAMLQASPDDLKAMLRQDSIGPIKGLSF